MKKVIESTAKGEVIFYCKKCNCIFKTDEYVLKKAHKHGDFNRLIIISQSNCPACGDYVLNDEYIESI